MSKLEERFDAVEEKSTRHFGLLAVLLGAVGIGLEKLVLIINGTCSFMGTIFIILYVVLAALILAAMVMYLLSMNYNKLKDLPMRRTLVEHFKKHRYVDVLTSLSQGNLDAIAENSSTLKTKLWYGKHSYNLTKIVLALSVLVGILYVLLRIYHPEIWPSY